MKKVYIIAGLLFLASCGQAEIQETKDAEVPATPETVVEQTVEAESEESESEQWDESEPEEVAKPEEQKARVEEENSEDESEEIETPSEEINDEVAALETAVEDTNKTITLDGSYTNPKGNVDMKIKYRLDGEGKIEAIGTHATTYDLTSFNNEIQTLVGSTLEDAAEYKSGSSLTGYAFTQAVKAELK